MEIGIQSFGTHLVDLLHIVIVHMVDEFLEIGLGIDILHLFLIHLESFVHAAFVLELKRDAGISDLVFLMCAECSTISSASVFESKPLSFKAFKVPIVWSYLRNGKWTIGHCSNCLVNIWMMWAICLFQSTLSHYDGCFKCSEDKYLKCLTLKPQPPPPTTSGNGRT